MITGRVNPAAQLDDQGITGLGNVYYNLLEPRSDGACRCAL